LVNDEERAREYQAKGDELYRKYLVTKNPDFLRQAQDWYSQAAFIRRTARRVARVAAQKDYEQRKFEERHTEEAGQKKREQRLAEQRIEERHKVLRQAVVRAQELGPVGAKLRAKGVSGFLGVPFNAERVDLRFSSGRVLRGVSASEAMRIINEADRERQRWRNKPAGEVLIIEKKKRSSGSEKGSEKIDSGRVSERKKGVEEQGEPGESWLERLEGGLAKRLRGYESQSLSAGPAPLFQAFFTGVELSLVRSVKLGYEALSHPVSTVRSVYSGVKKGVSVLRNPVPFVPKAYLGFKDWLSDVQERPFKVAGVAGEFAGDYLLGEGVLRAAKFTKGKVIRLATEDVPEVALFKQDSFPTTSSVEESLRRFERAKNAEGRVEVQTSSPSKIKGDVAQYNPKGAADLEDPGIYVTPRGEGSKPFLGLRGYGEKEFTLNFVKALRERLRTPAVTIFVTEGVERLPRDIIYSKGFQRVPELAGSAKAFITKRSEIGLGTAPRQVITVLEDVELGGKLIEKGTKRVTSGTRELEAIIPAGQKFTKPEVIGSAVVDGEVVVVRRAKLLRDVDLRSPRVKGVRLGKFEDLVEDYKYSYLSSGKEYTSPIPILPLSGASPSRSVGEASEVVGVASSGEGEVKSSKAGSLVSGSSLLSVPYSVVSSSHVGSSPGNSSGVSGGGSLFSYSGVSSSGEYQFSQPPGLSTPTSIIKPPGGSRVVRLPRFFERKWGVLAGFDVLVRERGVFRKVNPVPLSREDAVLFGALKVGTSPAATFRIKPAGVGARGFGFPKGLARRFLRNFELRKGDLFVEKREKRIKKGVLGELVGITFKGLRAKKSKKRGLFSV